jgi:hypothetical protein
MLSFFLCRAHCDRARLPLPIIAHEQPRLHVCPTSLAEIGISHVKTFYTNFGIVQRHGQSSPHQPGYQGVVGWFDITIEPDAYPEYLSHPKISNFGM